MERSHTWRSKTLVDVLLRHQPGVLEQAVLILGAGSLIGLLAQVALRLPFTPVPVTLQTAGVLLAGALLGWRRAGLALLTYLGEGLAGLPVFAGGASAWTPSTAGVPEIIGPTAGYLGGFFLAAVAVGWCTEQGWDRSLKQSLFSMSVGEVLIYVCGLTWLARFVGIAHVIPLGLLPFIPGDIVKMVAVATLLPLGWKLQAALHR
ncbi:MAG: biotin transporter BioY [Chloroflexi bacterium]|nr:biotin transporter BioY [Chloroflexota bacterium]